MTTPMPADQAAKVLRRQREDGWVFYYDPSTRFIGANHPKGGKQSIGEIRNEFSCDVFGVVIAALLNGDAAVAALEHQPKPAYCCAKCGLAEMHPRERALHQDAKRGSFRRNNDADTDGA